MPDNLSATSPGVAPADASAPDPSPPRGRPGTPPGGGVDGLASRKAPGTDAVRPMGVVKLTDLPRDLFKKQIADRLPLVEVARLATVNRASRETVAEYMDEPRAAVDKVRQMACESLKDRPDTLNAAFAARERMPPHERDGLMAHFAGMLDGTATPDALVSMFDHLLEAVKDLGSPPRAEMWALMAARIGRLPPEVQADAFGLFTQLTLSQLEKADMLVPLQALAGQIEVFPTAQRLYVMAMLAYQNQNSLDARLRDLTLDPPQQARLLTTLSEGIRSMGDGGQSMAFNFLRGVARSLPPEHRLPALEALSLQIHELPANERAVSLWGIRIGIQELAAIRSSRIAWP